MTYDVTERSQKSGSPVELYDWIHGETHYRETSAATVQEYGSEVFEPAMLVRGEITQSQEDSSGNLMVEVARDHPVAALHVPYLPSEKVALILRRRHILDGDEEVVVAFTGWVLSAKYESKSSRFVLTCGPISESFRKQIPIVLFQPQCNLALYSPRCGVNKEDFKITATVTAIDDDSVTLSADEFLSTDFEDGHLNNGWVQFGDDTRWIVDHVGDTVTLMNRFLNLSVGNQVFAFPGCMRNEDDCLNKFNNLDRHLGFMRIPTTNPFSTSVEY